MFFKLIVVVLPCILLQTVDSVSNLFIFQSVYNVLLEKLSVNEQGS